MDNKTYKSFRERTAVDDGIGGTGSYLLTSFGCFQRHSRSRAEERLTDVESYNRNFGFRSRAESDENTGFKLIEFLEGQGYKLSNDRKSNMMNNPQDYEEIIEQMKG